MFLFRCGLDCRREGRREGGAAAAAVTSSTSKEKECLRDVGRSMYVPFLPRAVASKPMVRSHMGSVHLEGIFIFSLFETSFGKKIQFMSIQR